MYHSSLWLVKQRGNLAKVSCNAAASAMLMWLSSDAIFHMLPHCRCLPPPCYLPSLRNLSCASLVTTSLSSLLNQESLKPSIFCTIISSDLQTLRPSCPAFQSCQFNHHQDDALLQSCESKQTHETCWSLLALVVVRLSMPSLSSISSIVANRTSGFRPPGVRDGTVHGAHRSDALHFEAKDV